MDVNQASRRAGGPVRRLPGGGAAVDMGWGRLLLGASFADADALAAALLEEREGERDIAFQLRDPHVVIAHAPHELFLDPSHTYRLQCAAYREASEAGGVPPGVSIREARPGDGFGINRVLSRCGMVGCEEDFLVRRPGDPDTRVTWVATDAERGEIVGTVTGVDHAAAYGDAGQGSSLWCLAADPECPVAGIGEALVRHLAEQHFARGRRYVDLSVLHDNEGAIGLYTRLGFERVREFTVKRRNPINEPLFVAPESEAPLNPYARIVVDEARRRGIGVTILDADLPLFELSFGGRTIRCRESLTDLTSAVTLQLCDDKQLTRSVFERAGLCVPEQRTADGSAADEEFLARHGEIVVKPARGEQGLGITVGVRRRSDLATAVAAARTICPQALLEECVRGVDLRVIVIGDEVVAAAVRRPPTVVGSGRHTVRQLVERYDRRRQAATGGESRVPLDDETARCVSDVGLKLDDVLGEGQVLQVRRTANLHTGGTIHDVTPELSPVLAEVAVQAARSLDIPVVGLDLIVPDVAGETYWLIEANERPGLANHEPQPTAQRFVDLMFPQTTRRRPPRQEGSR